MSQDYTQKPNRGNEALLERMRMGGPAPHPVPLTSEEIEAIKRKSWGLDEPTNQPQGTER